MTDDAGRDAAQERLVAAAQLILERQFVRAKALLLEVIDGSDALPPPMRAQALVQLARAHRSTGELKSARRRGEEGLALAIDLKAPQIVAVALETLALTEAADGHLVDAGGYFLQSARLELEFGNMPGRAAALSNYANMLIGNDMEGAEGLLKQALVGLEAGSSTEAHVTDNFALELNRQGRYLEAVDWSRKALGLFERLGLQHDVYITLFNLWDSLRLAGRNEEATEAFVKCHDLVHAFYAAAFDATRYDRYPETVAEIEAATQELPEAGKEGGGWMFVGLHAMLGQNLMEEGFTLLEGGDFSRAIQKLAECREHWVTLHAWHMLGTVDHHLGLAYKAIGDVGNALELANSARTISYTLGDAHREGMAISALLMLRKSGVDVPALELLAQGAVLQRYGMGQDIGSGLLLGQDAEPAVPGDGVLEHTAANMAAEAGADDLARKYYARAIELGRTFPEQSRHRLVGRLTNYLKFLLAKRGDDEARLVEAELEDVASTVSDDLRVKRALSIVGSRMQFQKGDRSPQLMDLLLNECRDYEAHRAEYQGIVRVDGMAETLDPPYDEAAQVALSLGHRMLALAVLERGKARTLQEDLDLALDPFPGTDAPVPEWKSAAVTFGVALLPTEDAIVLLGVDVETRSVLADSVTQARDTDGLSLERRIAALSNSTDSERNQSDVTDRLSDVCNHPTFLALTEALNELVPPGRVAALSTHSYLSQAPLQVAARPGSATSQLVLVPSLDLVPRLAASHSRVEVVAFGDPQGDLPYAKAEALLIGGGRPQAAVGNECTVPNLKQRCARAPSVVHLACHGRFDRAHPRRSGLLLAPTADAALPGVETAELLDVSGIGSLGLQGAMVILSACSSGLESLRAGGDSTGLTTALLAAGAHTIIAAQWPVPDLSSMLLMAELHERLAATPSTAPAVALGEAQRAIREMTAQQLAKRGFELAERLLDEDPRSAELIAAGCLWAAFSAAGNTAAADLVTRLLGQAVVNADQYRARLTALRDLGGEGTGSGVVTPLSHPVHWGAFVVVGGIGTPETTSSGKGE